MNLGIPKSGTILNPSRPSQGNALLLSSNSERKALAMAKKSPQLIDKMPAAAVKLAQGKAQAVLAEMPLSELRHARCLSQKMLADLLHVQQPSIAKFEKRADIYISTLRSHIEAMGGELDELVQEMFASDLADAKKHALLKQHGYNVNVSVE